MHGIEEIKTEKKAVRKLIAQRKQNISHDVKQEFSDTIMKKIETLTEFTKAHTLLLYYALADEVQTESFLKKWYSAGKRIVLPIVDGENLILKEYDPNMIKSGYQSILEPTDTCVVAPCEIELAIIPGIAFDASCNRIGRGKGFYDRLLPNIECTIIGVGYHFQIIDKVPVEEFDRPLNKVISENIIYCVQ